MYVLRCRCEKHGTWTYAALTRIELLCGICLKTCLTTVGQDLWEPAIDLGGYCFSSGFTTTIFAKRYHFRITTGLWPVSILHWDLGYSVFEYIDWWSELPVIFRSTGGDTGFIHGDVLQWTINHLGELFMWTFYVNHPSNILFSFWCPCIRTWKMPRG